MIVYVEDPKNSTKQPLQLKSAITNVTGYKLNVQKLIIFFYTSSKQLENKTKKKFYL